MTAALSLFGPLRPQRTEPPRPTTRAVLGVVVRSSPSGWSTVALVIHDADGTHDQDLGRYPSDLASLIADEQARSRDIPRLEPLPFAFGVTP